MSSSPKFTVTEGEDFEIERVSRLGGPRATLLKADGQSGRTTIANPLFLQTPTRMVGAGVVDLSFLTIEFVATGVGDAITVPDGLYDGQQLFLLGVAGYGSNTTVITPTNIAVAHSLTLSAPGMGGLLVWSASLGKWWIPGTASVL